MAFKERETDKEKQSKVGRSTKLRGQQTGRADTLPAQDREAMKDTPALRGRRKEASEFFGDESKQHAGADAATPRSNTPSVAGAMPTGKPLGETGGERRAKAKSKKAK